MAKVVYTPAPGKMVIEDWKAFRPHFLGLCRIDPFTQKLPDKKTIRRFGLWPSFEYHGEYEGVVSKLKAEGVLDPKFNPKLRVYSRPLNVIEEGLQGSETDPPSTAWAKQDCKDALFRLFGPGAEPDLERLQNIVDEAKKGRVPAESKAQVEAYAEQDEQAGLARAILRYAARNRQIWQELVEDHHAHRRTPFEESLRSTESLEKAQMSVQTALENVFGTEEGGRLYRKPSR
ncbi:Uncharacterised protein [uncultured archaeon]|nr:Uncharacterised protein [uncultured archaeon]